MSGLELALMWGRHMNHRPADQAERVTVASRSWWLAMLKCGVCGLALMVGGCEQASDQCVRLVSEGLSLAERGEHAAAFARFEQARSIDTASSGPWVASAELATDLGDFERADVEFSEAMLREPGNVLWQQKRAEVRQLAGRAEEAKGDYSAVVARDPSRASAWYNRGSIHAAEGNLPQAHADVEQALSRDDGTAVAR
jgi:tetratricopeptide (TPR) repeat protein